MIGGEIWYKVECKCGAKNWVDAGYFPDEDMSKMDVDGFTCWSCSTISDFAEEECQYPEDGKKEPT